MPQDEARPWSETLKRTIAGLAGHASIALQNAQLHGELQRIREREHELAYHDALTLLPNRLLFFENVKTAIARAKRNGEMLALMFLDLNGFKPINDTYGHEAGDFMLREVALRLKSTVRESDVVARMGGDEFTILINEVTQAEDAATVAKKVRSEVCKPVQLNGLELSVYTSIGISIYPTDGVDVQSLLKKADAAMYQAKKDGRIECQFSSSLEAPPARSP